jgi:hypothetical protein
MIEAIKEERNEWLFLLGVAVVIGWAYVKSLSFMEMTAIVPQFMMYIVFLSLVGIVLMKAFGNRIVDRLGLQGDEGYDFGDTEGETAGMYEMDLVGVAKQMTWITGYVLGIIYIGFFTVSIAFIIAYIMIYQTSPLKRRIPMALVWTAIIMTFLYVLFLEFLQVSSVWRLGFLP